MSKALFSRIKSCYYKLFSNLKEKEHDIIISRIVSSHMIPMHIETLYVCVILEKHNVSPIDL